MNNLVIPLLLAALSTPAAFAGAQQEKMKTCNATAKEQSLQGEARKTFMKECLSAKSDAGGNSQQSRMKTCNSEAGSKSLKGDERKAFMKECLSSKS